MPQHLEIHKTFVTPSHGQSIYSYLSELSFLRICDLPASPHLHSPKEEVMGAALPSPISISIPSQKIILFQRGILLPAAESVGLMHAWHISSGHFHHFYIEKLLSK